jgi:hypothetical protein
MGVVPPVTSFFLWPAEAVGQFDAGSRNLQGLLTVASSTRIRISARPWFPGRYRAQASAARRWPSRNAEWRHGAEEVTGEPLYRDRVCGIDIGKAQMAATIRVPSDKDPARRMQETREFATTKAGVLALAGWVRAWQVPAVVMEATSGCWKPVFYRLEAEGFECVLADARQVKNLPGRPKRDPSDSRWLTCCFERGAVTSCFVATPEFRIIRLHPPAP